MSTWQRPASVEYPQVYYEFEGKLVRDGKKNQYWVQDLTEEYFDAVIRHYTTEFMDEEVICKYTKSSEDPICLIEFTEIWKALLNQKISLICLTKDANGVTKIAGFNCLYASKKKDNEQQYFGTVTKRIINILKHFESQRNMYEEFHTDVYISAMGLFVLKEFRGEGLGQVILDCRDGLAKNMGITLSLTVFTGVVSQKQAERAGFADYVTITYEDLAKVNSDFLMPGIETESKICKLMYKEYK